MIRVVLAAALAVAIVAAAVPAVTDARRAHTATAVESGVEAVERAADSLVATEDATAAGLPHPRRVVSVRLPPRSWSDAGVAYVAVGGVPGGPTADGISYRLRGGRTRTVPLRGIDIRTRGGPVVLAEPGRHRLALELVRTTDGVAVSVHRLEP